MALCHNRIAEARLLVPRILGFLVQVFDSLCRSWQTEGEVGVRTRR